ncbi:unnamed protein product [Trifolium pratense]|uniref:Uncharacterized protein n=1 Tax=Trifolium pratense TaxID=57577 RepID=A0ACB0MBJ6_TRIPR|nr:unnamed protein product [Trifolium pratense]
MWYVPRDLVFSLAILLLLLVTPCSSSFLKTKNNIKSTAYLSPKFELEPGLVIDKYYYDIDFPKGHIAIKSFSVDIVDEADNPVPLHETYLHHWDVNRYYQSKHATQTRHDGQMMPENSDNIMVRNSGTCQGNKNGQYFGLGTETRGTIMDIPNPFGIEIGNPEEVPEGFEEIWMVNIRAIDMRGVEDKLGCTECRCDLYNVTVNEDRSAIRPNYKGGLLCCFEGTHCKLKEGFEGPKRSLYLKYTVNWVDWDDFIVPVKIYLIDVTDTLQLFDDSKGLDLDHDCRVEYQVESCSTDQKEGNSCVHVKRTSLPMQNGGYVIYGVAHQHSGGIGSTLYGHDGRVICSSIPIYGNGNEAGNEAGYVVGMSTCYPQPGSVKINDGETLTLESNYNNTKEHTGVMGHFYILVAEQLPYQHFRHSTRSSFFMDVTNLLVDN